MVGRRYFQRDLGQLVQTQGHAALLAGSSILVQNTLDDSLVDLLDSLGVCSGSCSLVTGLQSSVKLLNGGLQSRLVSLVLLVSDLGREDILLRGLNVGHGSTSYSAFLLMRSAIIAHII